MSGSAPVDYGLVRTIQAQVADGLTQSRQHRLAQGLPDLGAADERQLSLSLIQNAVSRHLRNQLASGHDLPEGDFDARLVAAVDAAIWGAGELQELLDDEDVENIDINGCDEVWVTYAGRGKVLGRPIAATDADLIDIIRTLGSYAGLNARPFTPSSPELDLRLPDGSRLSAIMSASERPLVSIRRNRFPQVFLTGVPAHAVGDPRSAEFATLLDLGTVDERLAAFLDAAVRARSNIIVAGATDAGKTTLLRALINCIPPHERLITVERALELGLRRHPHLHWDVAEMEEVLPGSDGSGGVDIGQLVRRSRRQNPSRVIVGEVLGPEVVEMLSAMSQGNDGSLSTIHARSATDVFDRLAVYAAQHARLDVPVTHALVGGAIDFVVFVKKNDLLHGRRTVTEVVEVTGSSEGRVTRSRVFTESPDDGRALRDREVPIMRAHLLARHGYDDTSPQWQWNGYPPHAETMVGYPAPSPAPYWGAVTVLPDPGVLLAAIICGGFGAAVVLLVVGVRGVVVDPSRPPSRVERVREQLTTRSLGTRVGAAAVVGAATLVFTRWPVAAAGLAALVIVWPQLFGGTRAERQQINQLEALVIWTESLRDTIAAHASLERAIPASTQNAPPLIRPALIRLAGQINVRAPLDLALQAFAADLDDASADLVIAALILNIRRRGDRLAHVLGGLATAAREELDMRRSVMAGRAGLRRGVQIVVGLTIGFAIYLTIFSPDYVEPYNSPFGQIALAGVIGMFAWGFTWMRTLAAGHPVQPFLSRPGQRISADDVQVVAYLTGLPATQARLLSTSVTAPGGGPSSLRPAGGTR